MTAIRFIEATTPRDVSLLGGKGAGLAFISATGIRIPPAFVVTADAYRRAVGRELGAEIEHRLAAMGPDAESAELEARTAELRDAIVEATAGHEVLEELREAYRHMSTTLGGEGDVPVAVRSSSIAEDAGDSSFAGEHDTHLWVCGPADVDLRVRQCWASIVTARAVAYRSRQERAADMAMAVVVQQMAPARSAGVFMTLNPVNGDRSKIMIESVWGLGEPLVSGEADPDRFLVDKVTGEVVRREIARKITRAVRDPRSGRGVALEPVERDRAEAPSLEDGEIAELVRCARRLETSAGRPQDAEFAVLDEPAPDNVRLLQCRPETAWSRRPQRSVASGRSALESVLAALTGTARTAGP